MTFQRALAWSFFWVGLSLLVALGIFANWGGTAAEAFLTGYTLEKALSVDNLFVFLMLFTYFGVDRSAQRRSLNYGLIGVLVLRGILIFAGIALVHEFEWILYALGVFVIYTGFIMALSGEKQFDPAKSRTVRLVRRFVRVSDSYHGSRFFIREHGRKIATPLFLVVCVIEVMDLLFAFDSIPAIFAVTRDPVIIYASNVLAVLGLRSMYFLLERAHGEFRFVKQGVGIILWFVGIKMILPALWPAAVISNTIALAVIIVVLIVAVVLSVTIKQKPNAV